MFHSVVVLSENPQRSLALPIVSVLDIETSCPVKLHIDNWTGKFDFVYRAWPLEQGSVVLSSGCIDDGLTRRRRQRDDHGHHDCRFRNVFRHVDLDRYRLDWRVGRGFGLRKLHKGWRRVHIHHLVPCNARQSNKFYLGEGLVKSIFQGILRPPFDNRWRLESRQPSKQAVQNAKKGDSSSPPSSHICRRSE